MLDMSPYDFDQSENGWRLLDKQGKYLEAAELIASYLASKEAVIKGQSKVSAQTIHFHAGQEYACAGKVHYAKAVSFLTKAYKGNAGWDLYVDGTIAFLEGGEDKLRLAADHLSELAKTDSRLLSNSRL